MHKQQYAALPYRFDDHGRLEVLLVTSRRTRRWIIPKGWPIRGLNPAEVAAREALEEAGVVGQVGGREIGRFHYVKLLEKSNRSTECEVVVFSLWVERQLPNWPEASQRETRWMPVADALKLIGDDGLRRVIGGASGMLGVGSDDLGDLGQVPPTEVACGSLARG